MTVFLIICHFMIVTILITVLTNSFMAIVQNANEEHQFLFAVNTISMVKSDALFSYIAPTNVIGWVLSPLRYLMPFRQYVRLNRTIIKVSHFPVLFIVFSYERTVLAKSAYEAIELVESQPTHQKQPLAFSINKAPDVFTPRGRLREPSVISFHKDRALDEVFRRPYRGSTVRTTTRDMEPQRRNSGNAVNQWMQTAENEGGASAPIEQPMSVVERLETRRPPMRRAATADKMKTIGRRRDFSSTARSLGSEPDIISTIASRRPPRIVEEGEDVLMSNDLLPQETDADGDEENNVESDAADPAIGESALSILDKENRSPGMDSDDAAEFFQTPQQTTSPMMQLSNAAQARLRESPDFMGQSKTVSKGIPSARKPGHDWKVSTGTTLFVPQHAAYDSSSTQQQRPIRPATGKATNSGTATPRGNLLSGTRTPNLKPLRARPGMPPRQKTAPIPATGVGMSYIDIAQPKGRNPSFNTRALDLASEIGDNKFVNTGGMYAGGISGMPNSFSEQLLREKEFERRQEEERRRDEEEDRSMVNRLLLSRMHTLEQGFREVLKEVKDISRSNASTSRRDSEVETSYPVHSRRQSKQNIGSAGGSANGTAPQTPVRTLSLQGKAKKSPRKHQRRKTGEIPQSVLQARVDAAADRSPESLKSVVEISKQGDQAEAGEERPSTAVRTPGDLSE